jgi:hypothetical protein
VRASAPKFSPGSVLLDWAWVLELLASVRNAWLASVTPGGLPHAAPLWIVVVEGELWFWTERGTAKGRNLLHSDAVALHAERGDDVAIVRGRAARCAPTTGVLEAYATKYEARELDPEEFWKVTVDSALAWQGHLGSAQRSATRFSAGTDPAASAV